MTYHSVFALLDGIESKLTPITSTITKIATMIQTTQLTTATWRAFHATQTHLDQLQLWEKKGACVALQMKQPTAEKIRPDARALQVMLETTNLHPQHVFHATKGHTVNHALTVKQIALRRGYKFTHASQILRPHLAALPY
jgi:hypothetical protein